MLSVQTGLNSQSAALSQTPSSPVGPALQDEEKKKQSHIPTVEVSAVQSQNLSARVGQFLANQANKPSVSDGASGSIAPTGADGAAPAPAAATTTPPPPPANDGGSSTDRDSDQAALAYSLLQDAQLDEVKDEQRRIRSSEERLLEEDYAAGDDDEDLTYSASQQAPGSLLQDVPPIPPANVGTIVNTDQALPASDTLQEEEPEFSDNEGGEENRESLEETEETTGSSSKRSQPTETTFYRTSVPSGDFSLYFDEAGTYQFAAA